MHQTTRSAHLARQLLAAVAVSGAALGAVPAGAVEQAAAAERHVVAAAAAGPASPAVDTHRTLPRTGPPVADMGRDAALGAGLILLGQRLTRWARRGPRDHA